MFPIPSNRFYCIQPLVFSSQLKNDSGGVCCDIISCLCARSSHSKHTSRAPWFAFPHFQVAQHKSKFPPDSCCKLINPQSLFLPLFLLHSLFSEGYERVNGLKALNDLAQANWNYGKSLIKLNCKNIAKTIKCCVGAINRASPSQAGLRFCCLDLFQVLNII